MKQSVMTLDHDESSWVRNLLRRKAQEDLGHVSSVFLKHYSKLLDSTIRKHWYDLCYKCRGVEGVNGLYHICEDDTAGLAMAFGGSILDYATDEENMKTWRDFLTEIYDYGVFKKVMINWLKEFRSPKEQIDSDRDLYYTYMQSHFPNPTQNPHQVFDSSDYEELQ